MKTPYIYRICDKDGLVKAKSHNANPSITRTLQIAFEISKDLKLDPGAYIQISDDLGNSWITTDMLDDHIN